MPRPKRSKTYEDILLEFKADKLAKRVLKNDQFNIISMGQTLENYGYSPKDRDAVMALRAVAKDLNFDTTKGRIRGMEVTDETAKLGFEVLKKPALFALVNTANNKCIISSSKSPWLRRAVMYFWLKNIHVYDDANTFFGHTEFVNDVEKYGPDVFKLHFIQELPQHIIPKDKVLLENEAERLAGDKLYFTKNVTQREYSPLRQFIYYHPELADCDRRFREIKAHYMHCKDQRAKLIGPRFSAERKLLMPILKAAHEEYTRVYDQQSKIREKLIKQHSQKELDLNV